MKVAANINKLGPSQNFNQVAKPAGLGQELLRAFGTLALATVVGREDPIAIQREERRNIGRQLAA